MQTLAEVKPEDPAAFRPYLLIWGKGIVYLGQADMGSSHSSDVRGRVVALVFWIPERWLFPMLDLRVADV